MRLKGNLDPTLRALGGRARYQVLQVIVINLGSFGASYQLLDNIFIGREVEGQRCSAPDNSSTTATQLHSMNWYSNNVSYSDCAITLNNLNDSGDTQKYPCLFGYDYGYKRELSFRTEFDLVCDHQLLGGLVQTCVILGQGIGAMTSSVVSDKFGRKRTLVASQLGLFLVGMAIGLAPSYPLLVALKFLVGCFQQGVVGTGTAMSIELFPMEFRSLQTLAFSVFWGLAAASMTFFAFIMRELAWRYLQYTLSAVSLLICLFQLWFLDESLRWLMANGKKEDAIRMMERAARTNGKKLSNVLKILRDSETQTLSADQGSSAPSSTEEEESEEGNKLPNPDTMRTAMEETLRKKTAEKLSILDIFRHKVLLINALIVWLSWFTCAFSFFTLYMMSTTLHGNRFLNYFLTALMEIPPGFLLYYLVDRIGRKPAGQVFYMLSGVGLVGGGICRMYQHISALAALSVVMSMVGMVGASGLFGVVFFITPELFPTNMRNQSVGVSSFMGRLGGMIAPFMNNLAKIAAWAPGALTGGLCFTVVTLLRFISETRGKELPHTVQDIKDWRRKKDQCELKEKF